MRPRLLVPALVGALVLGAGCTSTVEVQTTPMDIAIPVLSAGTEAYAEVAIDMPPHPQGDITIEQILGAVKVVNPSGATSMTFSLRLSTQGTAEPETPAVYTALNRPPYFSAASVLVPARQFAAGTQTDLTIDNPGLAEVVKHPRIYIIVSNSVTNVGLGDPVPVELQLKGLTFNVLVTKGFGSIGGATELTGL